MALYSAEAAADAGNFVEVGNQLKTHNACSLHNPTSCTQV
jgi:hypothetical protein